MSQDAKLNSHSKLNCVIACLQAEQAGADEALMLDPHGFVNTTNACNFFIVRRGEVLDLDGRLLHERGDASEGDRPLPGRRDPRHSRRNYSLYEAHGAEEAFLTGTFGAQTPVAEIDGKPVGDGTRPVTQRIRDLYKAHVAEHVAAAKGGA